jgi:putative oxidoreductase
MRIVVGLLFICHGLQKALGAFGGINGAPAPLYSLLGIGGWLELVLGLMITLGIFTGAAAFVASGEMAVAYFIGHFPQGFWPIVNQGEIAVLNCFVFLYIATRGSGIWSVDSARSAAH